MLMDQSTGAFEWKTTEYTLDMHMSKHEPNQKHEIYIYITYNSLYVWKLIKGSGNIKWKNGNKTIIILNYFIVFLWNTNSCVWFKKIFFNWRVFLHIYKCVDTNAMRGDAVHIYSEFCVEFFRLVCLSQFLVLSWFHHFRWNEHCGHFIETTEGEFAQMYNVYLQYFINQL